MILDSKATKAKRGRLNQAINDVPATQVLDKLEKQEQSEHNALDKQLFFSSTETGATAFVYTHDLNNREKQVD